MSKQEDCGGYPDLCAVFKGPVCTVCLCCQLCAEATEYEPGGPCPSCGKYRGRTIIETDEE